MNNETKSPQKPPANTLTNTGFSDPDWGNGIDDTYFLEATEDAEFAEATESSLLDCDSAGDEIPDELIVEVLQE